MSTGWKGSNRRAELPPDWEKIRQRIFDRDGQTCTWVMKVSGRRCKDAATDCDHVGPKWDHSDANLRSLCAFHHRMHTAQQAGDASRRRGPVRRSDEQHPGLL